MYTELNLMSMMIDSQENSVSNPGSLSVAALSTIVFCIGSGHAIHVPCLLKFNVSFRHCYGHLATYRNPEPGDNPILFSTDSKGSFRCTQPQTVMHTTKPLLNQLGTTGICPHRSNQPTQDSNPGPSDHESQTLCVSPPSEDAIHVPNIMCRISLLFTVAHQYARREKEMRSYHAYQRLLFTRGSHRRIKGCASTANN